MSKGDPMTDTLPINPAPWPLAAAKVEGHWTQGAQHDGDRMCLVGGLESCGLAPGEVFGPQWEQVCVLVLRAVRLTPDEAGALYAARDAARGAAWDAAWGAAWDAAWVVAWDAAWDAAWDVARDAASVLIIRDLIGSHGFTQAHYDLLTGPWRKVIGPVHPDDGPLP